MIGGRVSPELRRWHCSVVPSSCQRLEPMLPRPPVRREHVVLGLALIAQLPVALGDFLMKAIRIEEHGGPETLRLRNLELPDPGPGEVRIKLRAAGVNFVDLYLRRGEFRTAGPDFANVYQASGEHSACLPFTPGFDGAGIVDAVGRGVREFEPGDRVGYTGHLGTYAEDSLVAIHKLIPLPADLSFEQGAAFPLQGMTAHYLIHEFREPKPGDTVLIHAAAGGMGLLLVQWARHLGARVIGTVSTDRKRVV